MQFSKVKLTLTEPWFVGSNSFRGHDLTTNEEFLTHWIAAIANLC